MKRVLDPVRVSAAIIGTLCFFLLLHGGQGLVSGAENAAGPVAQGAGQATQAPPSGMAALRRAADAGKHLFIFFYHNNSDETQSARKAFESSMAKMARAADWVALDRTAPSEKEVIEKFDIGTAPMPLILAIAPNGVVTAGFRAADLTEQKLQEAIASPAMQKCLKALQGRKLVLLCVQSAQTKRNERAMRGVQDFKADARYGQTTEIVMLDPTDAAEASFLGKLGVDPKTAEATTVFLAPPGATIATFKGATDRKTLAAALEKAAAACGTGCGPSSGTG